MIELSDQGLRVSVLEPTVEQEQLGSRYCSGAYVWQVTDEQRGPLCAGPCFPEPEPPPFDGQGLPEVFEIALGQDRARVGDEVYVIGVGRVRRESANRPFHVRDNPHVSERATWELEADSRTLRARSVARFEGFAFELVRALELVGRTLTSSTRLVNTGARDIPVRWFAHPFFPWPEGPCCRLSLEYALPAEAPLQTTQDGFLERRVGSDWQSGHYLVPRVALGGELTVEQRHPLVSQVDVRCGFPLGFLALWGNARTWSFEPFFQTLLVPGARAEWSMAYRFG
jgi:hypothetical protein